MSTASRVPETWELTGDDAKETFQRTGTVRLLKDGFRRFRVADGFSHARSMAYAVTLVFLQGIIALVGLASAVGPKGLGGVAVNILHTVVPGPAGSVLTDAVQQAHKAGSSHRYLALIIGLTGALITGTTLMGQIERALNRIYGIEQDRPTGQKYGRAFVLTLSAGGLSIIAFVALSLGSAIGESIKTSAFATLWNIARWPLALVALAAGIALVFRHCPRRRQPAWSWLAFGAGASVVLLLIVTIALNLMFQLSSTFGKTYGQLAGIVALMLWALFASIALLLGAAFAAQLEAVRAGDGTPQSQAKVAASEPATAPEPVPALGR
ncbi:MAG: YihY/virulence factor BrkB family protein [Actinomycetota bacterium]